MSPNSLLNFAWTHKRIVGFGLLCALGSGFGQTFFISLSVQDVGKTFGLGKTAFGSLYGAATMASGLALPLVGGLIDRISLRRFVSGVLLGVAASALLLGSASSLVVLGLALFGIRFAGQGLMSHTASTTMSRVFYSSRGKALGIASLGYPLSEAIFPIAFTATALRWGWRGAWMAVACFALAVLLPAVLWLLRPYKTDPKTFRIESPVDPIPAGHPAPASRSWTRREVLLDRRFWLLIPFWIAPPFLLTGFFFHQMALVAEKGWSPLILAGAFLAFAVGRATFSFMCGPWVDRWGARRLLLLSILPLAAGLLFLWIGEATWVAWAYLALAGAAVGMGSNTKSAFLAELFGVTHLGAIRSSLMTLMIFATAASPPLFGWALDHGHALEDLALWGAAFIGFSLIPGQVGLVTLKKSG
jgi:MFS family permease